MEGRSDSTDGDSGDLDVYEGIKIKKNKIFMHIIDKIPPKITKKSKDRVLHFLKALNRETIDLTALKSITFRGIPDEVWHMRGVIWRLLLDYLPKKTSQWETFLMDNKKQYESFMEELIVKPHESMNSSVPKKATSENAAMFDHPLNIEENSVWAQYHKDREIWEEIEKDVKRTRNEIALFMKALKDEESVKHWERLQRQAELKKSELTTEDRENYIETHADILSRILFIYAKLNPGIRYVQGMNEILAVLYFVFYETTDPILTETMESDLFFCFQNIMGEIRDRFCRTLDSEDMGIKGRIQYLADLLKKHDPELHAHLEWCNINPQFYALKWTMLLLCQDFSIYDTARIWDTLLSDPERYEFLNYVCLAMLNYIRETLLEGDFTDAMQALQRFPQDIDIRVILNKANEFVADDPVYKNYIGDHF